MFVHPACLPSKPPETGERCYASGWGDIDKWYPEKTNELMFAPLTILDYQDCLSRLEEKHILEDPKKFKKLYDLSLRWDLCAAKEDRSICPGDFGGPLICNEDGKAVVHGIASSTSIMEGNKVSSMHMILIESNLLLFRLEKVFLQRL